MKKTAKRIIIWIILIAVFSVITACKEKTDPQNQQNPQAPPSTQALDKTDGSNNSQYYYGNNFQRVLEGLGQYSAQKGIVDYESGLRIFPLLDFVMTKKSIPANIPEQAVYMMDNPIYVTRNDKYANTLLFAIIHSKRTGVLHGVIGFPENSVTNYYEPMVFGREYRYKPKVPAIYINDKLLEVKRQTWENELAVYARECEDSLVLPPTNTERPFL